MQLLIKQFSPLTCRSVPLRSKYSPQLHLFIYLCNSRGR
jgi:hypothetical protein